MFTMHRPTRKVDGNNTAATGTPTAINATSIHASPTASPNNATSNATSTSAPACLATIHVEPFMGFNFKVHCDSDLYQHDLGRSAAHTVEECVDTCNHYPTCFGVTWAAGYCYLKGSGVSEQFLVYNSPGVISVLPDIPPRNSTAQDVVCPVPNLTKQPTDAGLDFKVLCGATLWYDDMYDVTKEAHPWMHARSLQECMENCANNHPLCSRVTYDTDPNYELWSNCWLKFGTSQLKPVPASGSMRHSAIALLPTLKPVTCKADTRITAHDGRIFRSSCQDFRVLNGTDVPPISISHTTTLDACMEKCTDMSSNCSAAAFDVGLQSGYKNCYLFNAVPPPLQQHANYTFVYLESLSNTFQAPPPGPRSSLNKGEIAASVTVPCAIVLSLFALYWFWYRKHAARYAPVKGD